MAGQYQTLLSVRIMVLLFILLPVTAAWAQDPQPFDLEEDTGFYYTIQKGDTLWDLSRKFYDSQWDWPGLWEMNKDIKNPHWIYPGNTIRVYLKPEYRKQKAAPAAPQPDAPAVVPMFNYPPIDHIGFIKPVEEPALGEIIRESEGNLMMSSGDTVYIRPDAGALVPGNRYVIFNTEPVKEEIGEKTYRGFKHLIKGEIRVTDTNVQYATAVIDSSYRHATVGDKIMPYYERDPTLVVDENPAPIDAVILCSEDNELLVNDHRVAFINKGDNHEIRPGQIYSILQSQDNRSKFDGKDAIVLDPLDSGRLIILHTEDESSTVLILSSKRDLHPGDMVN